MRIHCETEDVIYNALDIINGHYDGNITWRRVPYLAGRDRQGRNIYIVTLTVKDSKGLGARISVGLNGKARAVAAACWHVHGRFYDALWACDPNTMVEAAGRKLQGPDDNWQDWNIGSYARPLHYSEACRCEERGIE